MLLKAIHPTAAFEDDVQISQQMAGIVEFLVGLFAQ
jgi:hypothetical protein